MKHPRLILWYFTLIPMTISYIAISIPMWFIEFVTAHLFAAKEVLDNVLMRYELWAKYNEKNSLYNCPWKYTLREVYIKSLKGY